MTAAIDNLPSCGSLSKEKFVTVSQAKDLCDLIGMTSVGARAQAERKIGLAAKIDAIAHKQYRMPL